MFLLYVNDIAYVSQALMPFLFADDTHELAIGKNMTQLIETINSELEKLKIWLSANKLSLNVKKTHFMVFKTKNKKIPSEINPISIGNKKIKSLLYKISWNSY